MLLPAPWYTPSTIDGIGQDHQRHSNSRQQRNAARQLSGVDVFVVMT
jgi:hypothetical protein